jgi:general secretion pathway protein D
MKQPGIWVVVLFLLAFSLPASADQASAAYKRGTHAEANNQYEQAYDAYAEAHTLKPKDANYYAAYLRLRFYVAVDDVRAGQQLRDAGKLQEALAKFNQAAEIDETNFYAKEEARRTEEMIRKQARREQPIPEVKSPLAKLAEGAAGPVELAAISNTLINVRLSETSNLVYKTIGKLAGINVLFDSDYKPQKMTIELNDVTLREALDMVALQSKTFWIATSTNTILVAADTPNKRKELQGTVMKAFYMRNASTPAELQEAASTLKGILDINRVQLVPAQSAIILRGTPDQMVFAEKLLTDIDKPKSEVVIDVVVLQVSRSRMITLGAVPPTTVSVQLTSPSTSSTTTVTTGSGNTATGTSSSGGGFNLNNLRYLNGTNFAVTIPPYSFTALAGDSNTKVLQKPELWAIDNQKATLKIGDRIPIATGSFGASGGTQGYGALVNTQFQYIDVGVNIDITPHIHNDHEVTLKMTLEISSVTGTQNIGGINQPTIGQRRVELESRLRDGEVNLVGGILEDTESQSLSGYPGLLKVPILKYFFAQDAKQRQENEIVFAIMPHIIRSQELTDENLRLVDLGAGNSVSVRHTDPRKAEVAPSPAAPEGGASQNGRPPATNQPAAVPVPGTPQGPTPSPIAPGTTRTGTPPGPPQSLSPTSSLQPDSPNAAPPPTIGSAQIHAPT